MKRKDGRRVKNVDPMYQVAAHIMNRRLDAMNMITLDIPVEPMIQFIRKEKEEGRQLSRLAVILAAYVRLVSEFPKLNHFVVNSKIYARNEIAVGMVVLKGSITDGGTISKIYFQPTDHLYQVQERLSRYIVENRQEEPDNGTERMIRRLLSLPGLLRNGVRIFRWMDRYGMLPKSVIDMSPFHASLLLTDLASIRTDAIYHHVYEFGTTSVSVAMGNAKATPRFSGGEIVFQKCMPLGVVMDERIADGSYFAVAFHQFQEYLKHPELLAEAPKKIHPEIEDLFSLEK